MNESDKIGNLLYYMGVSFSLILIFETLLFYIIEMVFHYPSFMEEYGIWMGFEAFFLAVLSTSILDWHDKAFLKNKKK